MTFQPVHLDQCHRITLESSTDFTETCSLGVLSRHLSNWATVFSGVDILRTRFRDMHANRWTTARARTNPPGLPAFNYASLVSHQTIYRSVVTRLGEHAVLALHLFPLFQTSWSVREAKKQFLRCPKDMTWYLIFQTIKACINTWQFTSTNVPCHLRVLKKLLRNFIVFIYEGY
jgi:hypothetical protein